MDARRQSQRFLSDRDGGNGIVAALRLDEQAAQTQEPRIAPLSHPLKRTMRTGAIAVELRELGMQQQSERIVSR